MEVVYVNANNVHEWQQRAPRVAMALGYFDGVHLGHQQVIRTTVQKAQERQLLSAVLSFFPHPKSVLQPERPVTYLEPIEQKMEKLEQLGVDIFYVVEFTRELAAVAPDDFLRDYVQGLCAEEIVCGFDYRYGSKSAGDVETLAAYAQQHGLGCTVVEALTWNEQKISSTLIRQCLHHRKLADIRHLLGSFHKTKHCKQNGVLPYYALPSCGDYKVLVEQDGTLVEHVVTVKAPNDIAFQTTDPHSLANEWTIQWVDTM